MDNFVHLETYSAYSFLWGTFHPEDLVTKVRELGQKAVALTDFGLYGAVRFYKAAVSAGIQPIVGSVLSIWDGSPVICLARNINGYKNLCRLLSIVYEGGMAPRNLLSKQDLYHWNKDLVFIIGGINSVIQNSFSDGRFQSALFSALEFKKIIENPEFLYLAVQNHSSNHAEQEEYRYILEKSLQLSYESRLSLVAVNHVTFLNPEEYVIHRAFVAIQREHHHRNIQPLPHNRFYLADGREMSKKLPLESVEITQQIAELCKDFRLPLKKLHPPVFQEHRKADMRLAKLSYMELARNQHNVRLHYIRQLEHELATLTKMKLSDFFLLVREIVAFAQKRGIRHSIRGSAAGSLIVYLLLGGVDPIEHNLLFERFINEGRGDMPDIDIDFDSDRRDEIIHHVMNRFPQKTTMVCTLLSFKARSAVRLTARAMGYPLDEISRLAECLPWSLRGSDLESALENLPELKDAPLQKESRLIRIAAKIVGLPHQSSVHLGGVIIAPENIKDWTPVGLSPKGLPVGQLDKDDVDILGLMKLDLLGLRMHTAIRKSLEVLWRRGISLDLERVPLTDPKTYSLLCTADSVGIFQLESPGQRNLLGRLQPRKFSDLIAEISLFRPGPVEGDIVDPYVRRRNGKEEVRLLHNDLKPILAETYGVIVFQEQVLRVVNKIAGLSFAEADAFRRAMTKDRHAQSMDILKSKFIQGALNQGYSREIAENMFTKVAAFASFGFCKAHAASFAHITYQSAFLKAHHPQAFYLGLLNAGHVGSYPARVIINEARRRGIRIFGPDINESGLEYKAEGSGIRVPLHVIKGIGGATARRIAADRDRRGVFINREDIQIRLSLPESILSVLDIAGALESLKSSDWCLLQEVHNALCS